MEKTEINPATMSKINLIALLTGTMGLMLKYDIIPAGYDELVLDLATLYGPVLTIVFRTWFTEPTA